jgi:oligopeptide transport system ATP-binding protein
LSDSLVVVEHLVKQFSAASGPFSQRRGIVHAVDEVSFDIKRGETLALVGESGSGKSTVARCILRLIDPTSGRIVIDGRDVTAARGRELRALRRDMQLIFQDPLSSLNPRRTVGTILGEPLRIHRIAGDHRRIVMELMERVGLQPEHHNRLPIEFSGGQRQRIGIARALALQPKLIVCDEPVSALDVSIRAQILNLLGDLQRDLGLTYLFIAHDLSVVKHISTRVAVMHLGKLVEIGGRNEIYGRPHHPYLQALLSAVPIPDPAAEANRKRIVLEGDPPSPIDPPSGCRFRTRCWKAQDVCAQIEPPLEPHDPTLDHRSACHFADVTPG